MTDGSYRYDAERKEFVPVDAGTGEGAESQKASIPTVMETSTEPVAPVRRRKRKRRRQASTEAYFPQEEERDSGRFWRFCLWMLILAMVGAWAVMLTKQFKDRKKEMKGDKVYRIEKEDVAPEL